MYTIYFVFKYKYHDISFLRYVYISSLYSFILYYSRIQSNNLILYNI